MKDILKEFGQKILYYRRLKKLSQEDLASLANLHRTYIGQIETGKRNISLRNINKLAGALGVPIRDLF
jgi:transcriptional regulator with XRE-family HTH domain